ncbi:uncharacterized protein LOC124460301 [Drosophila willistoni]|uniref:uncharacterized protein LOC124460301 n=1 Tax=Drosophila willistoni TaxID=7260 RepID=UPI001F07CE97|nr:uncharacterized protein LOC124460301 [Drosophila willistoni]
MLFNLIKIVFLFMVAPQCFGGNNYDFRLESFLAIKGEEETLADFQNIKLIGRERALNGSFSVGIDLTDDILCSFEAFVFRDGNWNLLPYAAKDITFCELAKKLLFAYLNPADYNTNFPQTIEGYCPGRAGEYWIIEAKIDTNNWVSFMRRGMSKFRFHVFKNGKIVGGFELVGNIVDRVF